MKVIDPADEASEMGPLISAGQRDSVQELHRRRHGRLHRQLRPTGRAAGYRPRWCESRSTDEPVWREEVFGPVVAVMPFDDEEEAVALANDTEYGLSGSIFTDDLGRGSAGRPRRRVGQPLASTPTPRSATGPRSAATSSPASAASSARTPRLAFTEEKNVFIAH